MSGTLYIEFKQLERTNRNSQQSDELIKDFADRHALSVVVVHHIRKQGDSDVFNKVSGTARVRQGFSASPMPCSAIPLSWCLTPKGKSSVTLAVCLNNRAMRCVFSTLSICTGAFATIRLCTCKMIMTYSGAGCNGL